MDRSAGGQSRTEAPTISVEPDVVPEAASAPDVNISMTWYTRFGKRGFDIVVASLALLVVAPLVLLGAVVVRLSIGRPVFIKQFRVGRGSRPYEMRRLRTKHAMREIDMRDSAAAAPRVSFNRTAGTRRVRRWRFDTLPQLVNVVRGEMSLVGPRPMTWQDAVSDRLLDHPRHSVRPGLTGPAQVQGRGHESLAEQLAFDCSYLENIGLRRDVSVLFASVVRVLRR